MRTNDDNGPKEEFELTGEDNGGEPELADVEERSADTIKKLKRKLRACEEERRKLHEEAQRNKADFFNARKRLEEQQAVNRERMIDEHVERLLPLCDSFEIAMSDTERWEAIDDSWRKGVEGIHRELGSILASYGVKKLTPVGERFDPERHEAVASIPVAQKTQHDTVQRVVQSGYVRTLPDGERVIRPARVEVGVHEED